jgi:negative regulator of flagellin synthesis FlgM
MEISNNGRAADLAKILLGVQETDRTHNKKTASQQTQSQDRVQISERAKELQRLRAAAEQPDTERDARVGQIQQSVEGGTYTVDGLHDPSRSDGRGAVVGHTGGRLLRWYVLVGRIPIVEEEARCRLCHKLSLLSSMC